jgi:hypothetical protein
MDALFELLKETPKTENTCCMNLVKTEDFMVCKKCFRCHPYLVDDKFVYGERQLNNVYVPASYMRTKLQEFVGNVDINVPMYLFRKCTDTHDIYQTMKRHNYNTYESIYRIARELRLPYPILSLEEQERILFLFNQIPMKLPYSFVLSKLLQKIDRLDLVPFVYQPKNKKKLEHYESLFAEMKWF